MSNLSNIGFPIKSNEEFTVLAEKVYNKSDQIHTGKGSYFRYTDKSNAELWLQVKNNNFIGMNPHYNGISNRKVCLSRNVERKDSDLDGA